MVKDGVLMMGGAELEEAAPVLSFADRGFGERNLANTFLRLDSGFNEESLGWFDIVDMEVEKEGEVLVVYGVALESLPNKSHQAVMSGLVDVGGEHSMLGRLGLGALRFFLLQGLAVSVETMVSNVLSLSGSSLGSRRKEALPTPTSWIVRYIWVLLWVWWSLPFMVDSGTPASTYGPHRGLTLERVSESAVKLYCWLTVDVSLPTL